MKKAQAHQIRRVGLRNSIAQNEWQFILPGARVVLVFENGELVSGALILESRDFDEASVDVIAQLGQPDDFGKDYLAWRSDECNTVKLLKKDGANVTVIIQSHDYFSENSVRTK